MTDDDWLPLRPPQAGPLAEQVDAVFLALLAVTGAIALVIVVTLVWFAWRYRAGSCAPRPEPLRRPRRLELGCLLGLTLTSLLIFTLSSPVFTQLAHPPEAALKIEVVGKRWMWKVRHANGRRELDELHVPAGEPIQLILSSEDVIHSLYLPALRIKQDALPGRFTSLWFRATRPGVYALACAEYCGAEHAEMRGRLIVLAADEFQRWLEAEDLPAPRLRDARLLSGESVFVRQGCATCHRPQSDLLAPRLDGLWGAQVRLASGERLQADEAYLRRAILEPAADLVAGYEQATPMPRYAGRLDEDELNALLDFLRGLADGWPPEEERR